MIGQIALELGAPLVARGALADEALQRGIEIGNAACVLGDQGLRLVDVCLCELHFGLRVLRCLRGGLRLAEDKTRVLEACERG